MTVGPKSAAAALARLHPDAWVVFNAFADWIDHSWAHGCGPQRVAGGKVVEGVECEEFDRLRGELEGLLRLIDSGTDRGDR